MADIEFIVGSSSPTVQFVIGNNFAPPVTSLVLGNAGPTGPQGEIGETGPQGPQGIQGEIGVVGPQGAIGLTGPAGPKGDTGSTGSAGPKGDTGDTGPAGARGATGPAGPQGINGVDGSPGPTGSQGLRGIQGPVGAQGIPGIQGPAGSIGPAGQAGPAGPQGADAPPGHSVPAGGGSGQFLAKLSNSDYAMTWLTPGAGGHITGIDQTQAGGVATISGESVQINSVLGTELNGAFNWGNVLVFDGSTLSIHNLPMPSAAGDGVSKGYVDSVLGRAVQGPPGPAGSPGPAGAQGPAGDPGAAGAMGDPGAQGEPGLGLPVSVSMQLSTATLVDAQASPFTIYSFDTTQAKNVIIFWSAERGADIAAGMMQIVTNGTAILLTEQGSDLLDTLGVSFSVNIAGSPAIGYLQYTTSATGQDIAFTYRTERWLS